MLPAALVETPVDRVARGPCGRALRLACPALGVAGLLLVACGGGSAAGPGATTANTAVRAPGPGATEYETEPTPGGVRGPFAESVEAGVRRAAGELGQQLVPDGRLALLAEWVLDRLGEGGEPPAHEVVDFLARHLGLVEPAPHLLVLGQVGASAEGLEASVAERARELLRSQPYRHFGAAIVQRDALTLVVVALSTRALELDPVPRRVDAREVRLRGSLAAGYTQPEIAVARPNGEVRRVSAGTGPGFDVRVPLGGPGRNAVEVLAQGPRGDTVLANFPVWVGSDPPAELVLDPGAVEDADGSPEEVAAALFRSLNRARSERGLPPLERHDGLSAVALAHSRDMVARGFVGHRSPSTGDAPDRVRAAGYRSGLILENVGRGYGAREIHQGLMASPGHRANVLNPDVTHVGIGVVAEREGERTVFVVTEVFIRMNRRIDPVAARDELLRQINQGRAARGAAPLEADPNLARAAQEGAEAYFADAHKTQQDVVDEASGSLRRFALMFRRVGGLMAVVSEVDEAARLEPLFDPELRYIGVGVAQGDRPDAPPNSVAVVILLGWPR